MKTFSPFFLFFFLLFFAFVEDMCLVVRGRNGAVEW